jgi:ribonuclease P/MRP protein subunit RPP40
MLDIHRDDGHDTKVYFSHSVLPTYIDPQNVSTKKKPFSTFNAQPFSHTVRTRARPRNDLWARG